MVANLFRRMTTRWMKQKWSKAEESKAKQAWHSQENSYCQYHLEVEQG